jgi:hypothetical protein
MLSALAGNALASGFPYPRAQPEEIDRRLVQNYAPWQFRPMEPSNARGMPPRPPAAPQAGQPGTPYAPGQAPPGQYPGQFGPGQYAPQQYPGSPYPQPQYPGAQYPDARYPGYRPRTSTVARPRLEVELEDDLPYVQENVLVRLRVISSGNLATASPDLSGYDEVLLEQISGPHTTTRGGEGGREIVNEFVIVMTPLRPGKLEVGPPKVSGTLAGGLPFEALGAQPLRLQVRPAMPGVSPWLPLRSLTLKLSLEHEGAVREGRPVTLTLQSEARGGLGEQLPSLERLLSAQDYRIYREHTLTDTELVDGGRHLLGKRIEYYTLVPHSGGRLQLPEIRVNWWNVERGQRETATIPIRTFNVSGQSGPFGLGRSAARATTGALSWVWMPLAGLLLLLTGYWGGVWLRSRSASGRAGRAKSIAQLLPRLRTGVVEGLSAAGRGAASLIRKLNPTPLVTQAAALGRKLTPKSTRVYQCAAAANRTSDPAAWALAFQSHACRHLNARVREPLPRVADRIVQLRPGVDQARVRALMQQLDTALYNGKPIDFDRWKRDLRHALRPGTGGVRSLLASRVRRARLPDLNPKPTFY